MVQAGVRFSGRVQIKTNKIPMETQTVETTTILECNLCGEETSTTNELGPICTKCIETMATEIDNKKPYGNLVPDIKERLKKIEKKNSTRKITIPEILQEVSGYTEVPVDRIGLKTRKREIVQARQISMTIARHATTLSSAQIGARIGNKDHATVLFSCKVIIDSYHTSRQFRRTFTPLFEKFKVMSIFDKTVKHEKIYRKPNNL